MLCCVMSSHSEHHRAQSLILARPRVLFDLDMAVYLRSMTLTCTTTIWVKEGVTTPSYDPPVGSFRAS